MSLGERLATTRRPEALVPRGRLYAAAYSRKRLGFLRFKGLSKGMLGVAIVCSAVPSIGTARTAIYSTTTIIIVLKTYMFCCVLDI